MNKYEYITEEFVNNTKYKSLRDAYDRDYYSIVKYSISDSVYSLRVETRQCPNSIYTRILNELSRLYPSAIIFLD